MSRPAVIPGATTGALAAAYDAVIVGGGLQGIALAHGLAKRDYGHIAVLEAVYPGAGASGRNGEMIRSAFATDEWIGLFDESLRRWQTLSAELDFNVLFTKSGYLLLASTVEALAAAGRNVDVQRRHGLHVDLLDHDDVRRLCPAMAPDMIAGGVLQRDAGFAHHDATLWAYARAAARRRDPPLHDRDRDRGLGGRRRRAQDGPRRNLHPRRGRCRRRTGARDRAPRRRRRAGRDLPSRGDGDRAAGAVPAPRSQLAGGHGLLPSDHKGRVRRRDRAGCAAPELEHPLDAGRGARHGDEVRPSLPPPCRRACA